jgi:hypothetical protein
MRECVACRAFMVKLREFWANQDKTDLSLFWCYQYPKANSWEHKCHQHH